MGQRVQVGADAAGEEDGHGRGDGLSPLPRFLHDERRGVFRFPRRGKVHDLAAGLLDRCFQLLSDHALAAGVVLGFGPGDEDEADALTERGDDGGETLLGRPVAGMAEAAGVLEDDDAALGKERQRAQGGENGLRGGAVDIQKLQVEVAAVRIDQTIEKLLQRPALELVVLALEEVGGRVSGGGFGGHGVTFCAGGGGGSGGAR